VLKKKNIVITGALGQDGIILSKLLLKKKYNVFGVIKKNNSNKLKNITYNKLDLLDFIKISKFLDKIKPFCVIHLGTENPNYIELKNKKDFYRNNLEATKNLINYFSLKQPNKKLILIGTSQMYKKTSRIVNLKSKFDPTNSYANFRVESFRYMLKKKKIYNSNMTTAILFNHDSRYRKKKFLIPRLVKSIKLKYFKKINEIYQENISADFSHAEDICNGLFQLIISKKNPNKLIFSANKKTFINDLIDFLLKKNKIKKKFITDNANRNATPIGDNSYTKKILNWKLKKNIFIAANELNKI
jgi:GDPmannose 4,6-dehydratase